MTISVIVPVYITNDAQIAMTMRCLESAKLTKLTYELIIVETCSDYFKDECDIHIYEKEKTTCTKSINRGFKCASGDYVVLLTNDVILKSSWLECLLDCFRIKDCGLSTLATTQLKHVEQDKIDEGIWFSVAMMKKRSDYFDENYTNSWDDSDLIMRTYIDDKKIYRNFNCVVDHLDGATEHIKADHMDNFMKNREYFINKYKNHTDNRMYKLLTEGYII